MATKSAILAGTPYLMPVGVNSGDAFGNVGKLSLAISTEKKELPNYQGGGGNDDSFERFKSGTVTLTARHVSLAVLTTALGATATAVASALVTDEPQVVVNTDQLIATKFMQDMSAAMTVKNQAGTTTYVEGTHYLRKRAGIVPIGGAAGGIVKDDNIKITYTKHKHTIFQGLVNLIQETGLLFDGINERSGNPWRGKFHRVKWGPAKSLDFIGDDFASFEIEGEILAYDGITGAGLSPFFTVEVGDL